MADYLLLCPKNKGGDEPYCVKLLRLLTRLTLDESAADAGGGAGGAAASAAGGSVVGALHRVELGCLVGLLVEWPEQSRGADGFECDGRGGPIHHTLFVVCFAIHPTRPCDVHTREKCGRMR